MNQTVKLVFNLFKLRIGIVIAITALAGYAITPGHAAAWQVGVLALAVLVSSAAAGAFNQYYESDLDHLMERTRRRPFVTGAMRPHQGWPVLIAALCAIAVGAAWAAVNPWAALYTFLGAFFYAVVYTVWLKRRTWWNIVIGGLAGSFAVLAGSAAVTPSLSPEAMLLALVLFLWTPSHFWSLAILIKDDYAKAGVPMLPVVAGNAVCAKWILANTVALVGSALLPVAFGELGWLYGVVSTAFGLRFLWLNVKLVQDPSAVWARRNFLFSMQYLAGVFLAVVLDRHVPLAAWFA